MAWSAPMTAVANAAFTAAQFNQYVRDNFNETAPAKATGAGGFIVTTGVNTIVQRTPGSDTVNPAETTTSTSFTNLATPGPTATSVTSGTRVIVWITAQINNTVAGGTGVAGTMISGATSNPADDDTGIAFDSATASQDGTVARVTRYTVTPGSNTYQMQYRVTSGTGTFRRRSIVVLPF